MSDGEQKPKQECDLKEYETALQIAEAHIKLLTVRPIEETMASLTDFEQLKFKTTLAYALTTLQMCYLRTKNEDVDSHHNMKYFEPLKSIYAKMNSNIDTAK
jgi:hypothetical protein